MTHNTSKRDSIEGVADANTTKVEALRSSWKEDNNKTELVIWIADEVGPVKRVPVMIRESGSIAVNPAALNAGPFNWKSNHDGIPDFYLPETPYYEVGQKVFYQDRIFRMLQNYVQLPVPGTTDAYWVDLMQNVHDGVAPLTQTDGASTSEAFSVVDLTSYTNVHPDSGQGWFAADYIDRVAPFMNAQNTPHAANGSVYPVLTGPVNDVPNLSNIMTFTWTLGDNLVWSYQDSVIRIGTAAGLDDLVFWRANSITTTTIALDALRTDGSTLHVEHSWKMSDGTWTYDRYIFQALNAPIITDNTAGIYTQGTTGSPVINFAGLTADAGNDQQVWMRVKSGTALETCSSKSTTGTLGAVTSALTTYNWVRAAQDFAATDVAIDLTGVDEDFYVTKILLADTLTTAIPTGVDGLVTAQDITPPNQTPDVVLPSITFPTEGTALVSTGPTFTWVDGDITVTAWSLIVGSSFGASDLVNQTFSAGTLSYVTSGLPDSGQPIYVQFGWTEEGVEDSIEYIFTSYTNVGNVPTLNTPTAGSTLGIGTNTFTWAPNGATVTNWGLRLSNFPPSGGLAGEEIHFNDGTDGAILFVDVTNVPNDSKTVYARFSYKIGTVWTDVDSEFIAGYVAPTARNWNNQTAYPTIEATPYLVELSPSGARVGETPLATNGTDLSLKSVSDSEYDTTGNRILVDIPDNRDALIYHKAGAGPIGLPIFIDGGKNHVFVGLDIVTITQPGCDVGESINAKYLGYYKNVNPRVVTSKMIISKCTHTTFVHGCNVDIKGHECDFLVCQNSAGVTNQQGLDNRKIHVVNTRTKGWISLHDVPIPGYAVPADGVHGDFMQSQKALTNVGEIRVENVTMICQGNGTSWNKKPDATSLVAYRNVDWSRDSRYSSTYHSNGLLGVFDLNSYNDFTSENVYMIQGERVKINTSAGAIYADVASRPSSMFSGAPPGGQYALDVDTGSNYIDPF